MIARSTSVPGAVVAVLFAVLVSALSAGEGPVLSRVEGRRVEILFLGSAPTLSEAGWMTISAPKIWSETPLGEHVGTIWFRREIDLPAAAAGKPAAIRLGSSMTAT